MSNYPPPYEEPTPQAQRAASGRLSILMPILIGLLVFLLLPYFLEQIQYALTRGRERAAAEVAKDLLANAPDRSSIYRAVAKAIEPSVVGVQTIQVAGADDEWAHLFQRRPRAQAEGLGSGVIVDKAGYVITNFHVIDGATEVAVRLSDGRMVQEVTVVGTDPLTDIAVLKVNASNLVAATWGDSNRLEVGDEVLAIGNPFGLDRTVTAGIISAKGRREVVRRESPYQEFLQTDAAVNPGNSGGPLVDLKGQLIGINTAIIGEAYRGISFAIPSQIAKDVYERIRSAGRVVRGWLGVELQDIDERIAAQLRLKERRGALVVNIVRNGPAEKSGIEQGDVILRWGDEEVKSPSDLTLAVARTAAGSQVKAVIVRGGQQRTITVKVGERPARLR